MVVSAIMHDQLCRTDGVFCLREGCTNTPGERVRLQAVAEHGASYEALILTKQRDGFDFLPTSTRSCAWYNVFLVSYVHTMIAWSPTMIYERNSSTLGVGTLFRGLHACARTRNILGSPTASLLTEKNTSKCWRSPFFLVAIGFISDRRTFDHAVRKMSFPSA